MGWSVTAIGLIPQMQACVDRYARALLVPSKLLTLHPRQQGNPGNAQAVCPAITLGVISAFEGFAEDMLATALYLRGQSFAQVAKRADLTNPDVKDVEKVIKREFPEVAAQIGVGVQVYAYRPLLAHETGWQAVWLDWSEVKDQAEGWMQVRHCLTHGLVSGWRPELWPGPMRRDAAPASAVLRTKTNGEHSLGLDGAITCARIYMAAAEHFVALVASELGQQIDWRAIPDFPM
jgi:hypothetical protein